MFDNTEIRGKERKERMTSLASAAGASAAGRSRGARMILAGISRSCSRSNTGMDEAARIGTIGTGIGGMGGIVIKQYYMSSAHGRTHNVDERVKIPGGGGLTNKRMFLPSEV